MTHVRINFVITRIVKDATEKGKVPTSHRLTGISLKTPVRTDSHGETEYKDLRRLERYGVGENGCLLYYPVDKEGNPRKDKKGKDISLEVIPSVLEPPDTDDIVFEVMDAAYAYMVEEKVLNKSRVTLFLSNNKYFASKTTLEKYIGNKIVFRRLKNSVMAILDGNKNSQILKDVKNTLHVQEGKIVALTKTASETKKDVVKLKQQTAKIEARTTVLERDLVAVRRELRQHKRETSSRIAAVEAANEDGGDDVGADHSEISEGDDGFDLDLEEPAPAATGTQPTASGDTETQVTTKASRPSQSIAATKTSETSNICANVLTNVTNTPMSKKVERPTQTSKAIPKNNTPDTLESKKSNKGEIKSAYNNAATLPTSVGVQSRCDEALKAVVKPKTQSLRTPAATQSARGNNDAECFVEQLQFVPARTLRTPLPAGSPNIGNSCYLSIALQMLLLLFNVDLVTAEIFSSIKDGGDNPYKAVVLAVISILRRLKVGISPTKAEVAALRAALFESGFDKKERLRFQQDANAAITKIVECMGRLNQYSFACLFGGDIFLKFNERFSCEACDHVIWKKPEAQTEHWYIVLSVPAVDGDYKVGDLLHNSGLDCPKCQKRGTGHKITSLISQCPPILRLSLDRVQQDGSVVKVPTKVLPDESISICGDDYPLVFVAWHVGDISGGHYYCMSKTRTCIALFDDASVRPMGLSWKEAFQKLGSDLDRLQQGIVSVAYGKHDPACSLVTSTKGILKKDPSAAEAPSSKRSKQVFFCPYNEMRMISTDQKKHCHSQEEVVAMVKANRPAVSISMWHEIGKGKYEKVLDCGGVAINQSENLIVSSGEKEVS